MRDVHFLPKFFLVTYYKTTLKQKDLGKCKFEHSLAKCPFYMSTAKFSLIAARYLMNFTRKLVKLLFWLCLLCTAMRLI